MPQITTITSNAKLKSNWFFVMKQNLSEYTKITTLIILYDYNRYRYSWTHKNVEELFYRLRLLVELYHLKISKARALFEQSKNTIFNLSNS